MSDFLSDPVPGADLQANRAFAEWVRDQVRGVKPYPELTGKSEELVRAAEEVIAAADRLVTVGLFGEYNTGKSLTLGTLVGNPLLLPVQSEPATANITRLRLTQSAGERPAEITAAYAEFVRADDVPGFVAAIVRQAADTVRKLGLRAEADGIEAIRPSADALPGLAAALERLAAPGSQLASRAAEVRELDAALQTCPLLGETVPLDPANPWQLIAHDRQAPVTGSGSDPGAYRSLVRQIVLDVSVPVWAWNLQSLRGATLHLVDIPGIGSQAFRDSHVGQQEMEQVTAALAVVSATRASAADSWAYVDQLVQRVGQGELARRLMIAATRFDSLEGVPGSLLDSAGRALFPQPLAEEEFLGLEQATSIRALVTQIRRRVAAPDRFTFVSPLVTIGRVTPAGDVRWSPDQVINRLPISQQDVDGAVQRADGWARVGAPDGPVGGALTAFWTDGGMARLRVMLTQYVLRDGLDAHVKDVAARAEALRGQHTRFRDQVSARELADSPEVRKQRSRQDAQVALIRYTDSLKLAAAQELRDPRRPPASGAPSLWDLLEQNCAHLVFSWPQWQLLLGSVRDNLVVVPRDVLARAAAAPASGVTPGAPAAVPSSPAEFTPAPGDDLSFLDDYDPDQIPAEQLQQPPPVLAGDLLPPFRQSCADLRELIRKLVAEHLETWCRDRTGTVAEEQKIMDEWLLPLSTRDAAVRSFYPPVRFVTDPDRFMRYLRQRMEGVSLPEEPQTPESFPLDPARALPWHPDSPRREHVDRSGPVQMLRVRRELIRALVREGSTVVRLLLDEAAAGVDQAAGQASRQLAHPPAVARMASAGLSSPGDAP